MTARGTGMVMAEDVSAKCSEYNNDTDKTYVLEYWFQNNQLPILKNNPLFSQMLLVASFNFI